ncbi:hypothetical protein OHJ28_10480 [Dickeya fangzhongdai]|uniref:hypothetical protein n=1 Tax=Dickeya fangzhongdai TaxID=1778540 RepID=UPI003307B7D7
MRLLPRLHRIARCCSSGIVFFAALSAIMLPTASAAPFIQPASAQVQLVSPSQQVAEKSFAITPRELVTRINDNLFRLHCTFRFTMGNDPLSSEASSGTYSHIKLTSEVSQTTGRITVLKLIVAGDGTQQSGIDNLAAVVAAYGALLDEKDEITTISPTVKQLLNAKTSPAMLVLDHIRFIRVWQGGTNLFAAAPL